MDALLRRWERLPPRLQRLVKLRLSEAKLYSVIDQDDRFASSQLERESIEWIFDAATDPARCELLRDSGAL